MLTQLPAPGYVLPERGSFRICDLDLLRDAHWGGLNRLSPGFPSAPTAGTQGSHRRPRSHPCRPSLHPHFRTPVHRPKLHYWLGSYLTLDYIQRRSLGVFFRHHDSPAVALSFNQLNHHTLSLAPSRAPLGASESVSEEKTQPVPRAV